MAFLARLLGLTEPVPPRRRLERLARTRPEAFIVLLEAWYLPRGGRDELVVTLDANEGAVDRTRTPSGDAAPRTAHRALDAAATERVRAMIEAWAWADWLPPQPVGKDGLRATFIFALDGRVVHEVTCPGAAPAEVARRVEQLTGLVPL